MNFDTPRNPLLGVGVAALVLMGTGCAHVGQEEFDGQIADLRQMIQEGDQANTERANALEARLDDTERRMTRLERELSTLSGEFDGMKVELNRMSMAVRAHVPIHFGFDESEVPEGGEELLDRFGSVVAEFYPTAFLTVEGFTDPVGTEDYNMRLGQARADAVRSHLLDSGPDPERIRAVSYGEDTRRLLSDRGGPDGEGRENRRVVIVIDAISPDMSEVVADGQSGR